MPVGRPLHRGSHRLPLWQRLVIAHADLIAVSQDGGPGEGEEQAVGQLYPPLITAQHGGQASTDATPVEPHAFIGRKGLEDGLPILLAEATEVEFVMAA